MEKKRVLTFVHQHAASVVAMWATLPPRLSCRYQREPGALSAWSGRLAHKTQTFPRIVPCMLKGPLTLLEGAPVSIFSWVAMRTDMVCVQVPLVSLPLAVLCTFVQ